MLRYAITDRTLFSPQLALHRTALERERQAHLLRQCRDLAAAGVDFVQLREKDLHGDALVALGKAVRGAIRDGGAHTRLLLNVADAAGAASAVSIGADGVHLTSAATISVAEIAGMFREGGLPAPSVSVSCHTLDEVRGAREAGVSAILFGPVFGKTVDGEVVVGGVGLERLGEACRAAGDVPVFALGGATLGNARGCVEVGAAGVAGIRMFFEEVGAATVRRRSPGR